MVMNTAALLSSGAYFLVTENSLWVLSGSFSFLLLCLLQLLSLGSTVFLLLAFSPWVSLFLPKQNQSPVLFSLEMFYVLIRNFFFLVGKMHSTFQITKWKSGLLCFSLSHFLFTVSFVVVDYPLAATQLINSFCLTYCLICVYFRS